MSCTIFFVSNPWRCVMYHSRRNKDAWMTEMNVNLPSYYPGNLTNYPSYGSQCRAHIFAVAWSFSACWILWPRRLSSSVARLILNFLSYCWEWDLESGFKLLRACFPYTGSLAMSASCSVNLTKSVNAGKHCSIWQIVATFNISWMVNKLYCKGVPWVTCTIYLVR